MLSVNHWEGYGNAVGRGCGLLPSQWLTSDVPVTRPTEAEALCVVVCVCVRERMCFFSSSPSCNLAQLLRRVNWSWWGTGGSILIGAATYTHKYAYFAPVPPVLLVAVEFPSQFLFSGHRLRPGDSSLSHRSTSNWFGKFPTLPTTW